MQKLFIRIVLSFTLSASILSCALNLYTKKPPAPKKQVIEAPLYITPAAVAFWRAVKYVFFSGGGTGKSPMPKPSG